MSRFVLKRCATDNKQDTRLPPGYFPPPTFLKMRCQEKLPLYMRSISHWPISPVFFEKKMVLDFGRKKAFLRNITFLSAFFIKFAALSKFLKFRFSKKSTFFPLEKPSFHSFFVTKPFFFIRLLW